MIRRIHLKRVLLALGSLLASLAAAEIGLRLHHTLRQGRVGDLREQLERSRRAPLDHTSVRGHFTMKGLVQPSDFPGVVYEIKPRLDGDFKGALLQTNSWGFRGPEVELRKPAGTLRILGLGDSFMFGWGVDREATYLARLERALNERGTERYEVLNLAVPGYNTWMEVAAFAAKGLAFAPDVVVMHFFRNDLQLPFFMLEPDGDVAGEPGLYLVDLLRSALEKRSAEPEPRVLVPNSRVSQYPEALGHVRDAHRHMVGEAGYRRAMERLARLTSERSIPVVVILLDDQFAVADLVREVVAEHGFRLLEPRERFLAYLAEHALGAERFPETFQVSAKDLHLNELGHALIADSLLALLVEQRLLPVHHRDAGGPVAPRATGDGALVPSPNLG